jgi:hypothetical protein
MENSPMPIILVVLLILTVVGLVVYMVSAHARVAELGRILFMVALFIFLLVFSGHGFRV